MIPLEASIRAQTFGWGWVPPVVTAGVVAAGGWTSGDLLANVASIIATSPDHVIGLVGVNDFFNHGGTPITPADTQANIAQIMSMVRAAWPTCVFHWISPMWSSGELWPVGSNPDDASVTATATGIKAAVLTVGPTVAEYIDLREDPGEIWSAFSPVLNPAELTHGVLTQLDGVHPSKPLGMQTLSDRVFQRLRFSAT